MADILICGMDRPFNCFACDLSYFRGERLFCCVTKDEVIRYKIASDCPLHELPEHGDLVDIRKVIEIAMQYVPDDDGSCSKANTDLRELLDEIENAPVIVPSNKEGSECF